VFFVRFLSSHINDLSVAGNRIGGPWPWPSRRSATGFGGGGGRGDRRAGDTGNIAAASIGSGNDGRAPCLTGFLPR